MLEVKKWNDYSFDEQSELLNHWFYYYGKIVFSLAELDEFNELIKKDINKILMLAVVNYIIGLGSQTLIYAMRTNDVDYLLSSLPNLEEDDEEKKAVFAEAENDFISMLVKSYNNPEPRIPMDFEKTLYKIK